MTDKRKPADQRRAKKSARTPSVSVLGRLNCPTIRYEFDVPVGSFDSRKFFKVTGIKGSVSWAASLRPKDRLSAYHVHFSGLLDEKRVRLTVEYFDRSTKTATKDDKGPFAESIMPWVGSFIKKPMSRALGTARFEKPTDSWRSRFNLPFKVTMGDAEVVIDGVSLDLPRNPFRAGAALLLKSESVLSASIQFDQIVDFSKFDIASEVASLNEAVKIFLEPSDETKNHTERLAR